MLVNYCVQLGNYLINQHKNSNNKEIEKERSPSHESSYLHVLQCCNIKHFFMSSINFGPDLGPCQKKSCLWLHGWWIFQVEYYTYLLLDAYSIHNSFNNICVDFFSIKILSYFVAKRTSKTTTIVYISHQFKATKYKFS